MKYFVYFHINSAFYIFFFFIIVDIIKLSIIFYKMIFVNLIQKKTKIVFNVWDIQT